MKIRLLFLILTCSVLLACGGPFKGVKGVKSNGNPIGALPSKELRENKKRQEKRQARSFKKEMKKRAKRLGTTKKR